MGLKQELLAMAGMAAYESEYYTLSRHPRLTSHQKEEKHYTPVPVHVDRSEREFVIRGEKIMAHDKITAKKIYAKRHKLKKI